MRRILLRLHRWVGLYACLFVLVLSLTGILLNHTEAFKLDEKPVRSELILNWYGLAPASAQQFSFSAGTVEQEQTLVKVNGKQVGECKETIRAVLEWQQELFIVCTQKVFWLALNGDLLEVIDKSYGLPVAIQSASVEKEGLLLNTESGSYLFKPDSGEFLETQSNTPVIVEEKSTSSSQVLAHSIHWERLLLDLHSGRLLGGLGVWLFDLAALGLIFLALSGLWNWWQQNKRKKENRRN